MQSPHLLESYRRVRQRSLNLVEPLEIEDFGLQSMPEASPAKWHLAHTTWFFETFVLRPFKADYHPFHPLFEHLLNSYYNTVGEPYPRPRRHLQSRPTVAATFRYRQAVDEAVERMLVKGADEDILSRIELGCHHEQQHQELLLTDLQHAWWFNPMRPQIPMVEEHVRDLSDMRWVDVSGGLHWFGHRRDGFAFDNESPAHQRWLEDFSLASRLVTNGEFLAFMEDGGYTRTELWLSNGWDAVQAQGWKAPLYWYQKDGVWWRWSLAGDQPVDPDQPVVHISYYEADAYARWSGARLPSEFEWEQAASLMLEKNDHTTLESLFDEAWQWTASPYLPYPGFKPSPDAIGEYNGKFMCDQWVLKGGSLFTPSGHTRASYRNFFPAHARWQRTGIRLARDNHTQPKDLL